MQLGRCRVPSRIGRIDRLASDEASEQCWHLGAEQLDPGDMAVGLTIEAIDADQRLAALRQVP
ncbi:hypothetical protein WDZ92_51300, partial [Nostoc sp. NIES-2111]